MLPNDPTFYTIRFLRNSSLPRSRFLDVTQRGGALCDIQTTAARETSETAASNNLPLTSAITAQ